MTQGKRTILVLTMLFLNASFLGRSAQAQEVKSVDDCEYEMHGIFELRFSAGPYVHDAELRMAGCTGTMTVTYAGSETGTTETVRQFMRIESSAEGLAIAGYNPVDPATGRPRAHYSADNLLIQILPTVGLRFRNCDDAGRCSDVKLLSEKRVAQ